MADPGFNNTSASSSRPDDLRALVRAVVAAEQRRAAEPIRVFRGTMDDLRRVARRAVPEAARSGDVADWIGYQCEPFEGWVLIGHPDRLAELLAKGPDAIRAEIRTMAGGVVIFPEPPPPDE